MNAGLGINLLIGKENLSIIWNAGDEARKFIKKHISYV